MVSPLQNSLHAHAAPSVILVGCGAVSRLFYQPALRELSRRGELVVAALVDPADSARADLGAAFPKAHQARSLDELILPEGALAVIASPPRFHSAQCHAALERGWHVLCEKPMAPTPAECVRMTDAARCAHRVLAVGLYKRFFPSSAVLRELCRGSVMGPLVSFDVHEGGPFRWPAATPSFFSRAETPGGVLLDLGVHVLDLLLWWLGDPTLLEYADDAAGGLEANAVVRLGYPSGATGRVQLSRDWATRQRYHFEFQNGSIEWTVNDANGLALTLHGLPSSLRGILLDPASVPTLTNPQCFIAQLQNVLAAVRGGFPPLVTGEDGTRVMRLIATCYARRQWLEQPWLGAGETARAREHALLA